jgi:hypothetical protein
MSHHYVHDDPRTWYTFDPKIIAHDVGHTRDRSTAVVGGNSYAKPRRLGILELHELPLGLYGSQRASALRQIDSCHGNNALIVADLCNDASYAENLFETFRSRLIGLRITRHGEGMERESRQVLDGFVPVYTVGRSHLFELYLAELHSRLVKIVDSPMARKAHSQLEALEVDPRESGTIYRCLPGPSRRSRHLLRHAGLGGAASASSLLDPQRKPGPPRAALADLGGGSLAGLDVSRSEVDRWTAAGPIHGRHRRMV